MAWRYTCENCLAGSDDIEYIGHDEYRCKKCGSTNVRTTYIASPYERCRAAVYATGNRWAIENWNATH